MLIFPTHATFSGACPLYEYLLRGDVHESRESVGHHRGSSFDFLRRHENGAATALQNGVRGAREIAPYLFARIADSRTMRMAWDTLAARGGKAPGPDGHRYTDYTSTEVWALCRCVADSIRSKTYRPGPERVRWIAKASGRGQRPIILLNIVDRVVQRAIVSILQPVLDPLLDPHTLGFRPRLGSWHALALAEHLTLSAGHRVWVTEDIRDAFQHVPVSRALQVFEKLLPSADLVNLLALVLPGQTFSGLKQGGPLSPLALNIYLAHILDRPWRRRKHQPLIRVADDLLVLCRSGKQADAARAELRGLLLPAGMQLKDERRFITGG
jgi:RNA-directed DNA polymerase